MTVRFYDHVVDEKLGFAVIAARYRGKWVCCRHRERTTWEVPGGHRETGEAIADTAKRELYEETGAADFTLRPVCVYSVTGKNRINDSGDERFGMLYFAEISTLGPLPKSEIADITLLDHLPRDLTYPEIQPKLMEKVQSALADE